MEADEDDASTKNLYPSSCSPEEVECEKGDGMREDILSEAVARTEKVVVATVLVGDEFACEGGEDGDAVEVTSRVVETAGGAEDREAVAADMDEGMRGVVATVDREVGVGNAEVAISLAKIEEEKELEAVRENEIQMVEGVMVTGLGKGGGFGEHVLGIGDLVAEKVEFVVSEDVMEANVRDDDVAAEEVEDGGVTVWGGDNERDSDRKEDMLVVADARDSGGFSEQDLGMDDLAAEKAELLVSEDMMDADVGDAEVVVGEEGIEIAGVGDNECGSDWKEDVVVSEDMMDTDVGGADVVAGEEGIETVGGGDNDSVSDRKEDVVVVADVGEYMEFHEHVMGICDREMPEKVELMKSENVRAEDVGVADVEEKEDMGVSVDREKVIEDGRINNDLTSEGQDDVVTADVDDSQLMKEKEGVVIVVEGNGSAVVEERIDVGSHDVELDRKVIELKENEIDDTTINDSSRNGESMGGAVSLCVKVFGIADFKGQISLAENEVVTDGGEESKGVVGMVDEIDMAGKNIVETDEVINTRFNGAAIEDKKETVDPIVVGVEELVAAGVGIVSDDASPRVGEINETENADGTEDGDDKEVANVGDEIDAEAVENDFLEDKDIDVVEETKSTEDVDRTGETDATEDTDMAEKEKVKQREGSVLLNRKGGRNPKGGRGSTKKKLEEDVCFICFDGGELVLCDRRGCHKVYHPSCVNRDEDFFQTKGQWNCGWHLCSSCGKNAHYFCYTCTFSLCKGCFEDAIIYVVRGNKGFCDICMRTVKMIESVIRGDNQMGPADFDDKTSWEYLFKNYYMDLKEKLSLSAEEIRGAKNSWKGTGINSGKQKLQDDTFDVDDDGGVGSDDSAGQSEVSVLKKRKASKRMTSHAKERKVPKRSNRVSAMDVSKIDGVKWATKELLDFVMYMKKGDISVLSQFDVQALLLEYIKTNKLRDPRRKSQIICDSRLQSLFGKSRVGHFEMLKLLESHFLVKDDTDDLQGSVVDTEANHADADPDRDVPLKAGKQKKRKTKKSGDDRGLQSNIDDHAAIDTHNITLIYLRRSLVEYLLEDAETFDDKVIGSFVRIRIPGNTPKLEMYRLVPIIGTSKVSKPYKVGKKHTDYVLEIQNFGKAETIQIDIISNQEFTQDECLRLKQSMKYGVISRLTVGDIQDKAIALQEVRVKDWLDAEIVRLSHLRDRASEKGHAKELRECVEKLQLLKTPQERQRRLNKVPEIHSDPKMDPNNESEDGDGDNDLTGISTRGRSSSGGRSREPISPSKGVSALSETRNALKTPSSGNRDLARSMSGKGLEGWIEDGVRAGGDLNQNMYTQSTEREIQRNKRGHLSSDISARTNTRLRMESISRSASLSANTADSTPKVNESEKMWLYKDPSGKIQGPFSMVQLRKWSNTGYFPTDLMIWRAYETPDDSVLLANALKGKYQGDTPRFVITESTVETQYSWQEPVGVRVVNKVTPSSVDMSKFSASQWSSGTNLPSPTPHRIPASTSEGPFDEVKRSVASSLSKISAVAESSTSSLINTGSISGSDVLRNVSSVLSQDPNMLMNAASALLAQSQSALPDQQRLSMEVHVEKAQAPDVLNPGSTFQNLAQAVQSHYPAANARGWGFASASSSDLNKVAKQPPVDGQWGEPPASAQNPAYGAAGSASTYANPWRPYPSEQLSMQFAAVTGTNWGVSNSMNTFAPAVAASSSSQQNPNPNWMQGSGNTGWTGSVTGNSNMNWSTNPNAGRAQGPGIMPGWNPPSQGQSLGNNTNAGLMPLNQAPPQNTSSNWSGQGNQSGWMGETSHNDSRYREGGDYGYGGDRSWNRQMLFDGGGRDQGVCWYQDEHGNCRRGASCKFRHAGAGFGNLQ